MAAADGLLGTRTSWRPRALLGLWAAAASSGRRAAGARLVVENLTAPQSIDVDPDGRQLYWTEPTLGRLSRASLDGDAIEVVVQADPGNPAEAPCGVAAHSEADVVYWTTQAGAVRMASGNGSSATEIVAAVHSGPRAAGANGGGIVLDTDAGMMYWAVAPAGDGPPRGAIWGARLDGSLAAPLVTEGVERPTDVALDAKGRRLFWADAGRRSVQWASVEHPVERRGSLNISWSVQDTSGISIGGGAGPRSLFLTSTETRRGAGRAAGHAGAIYRANLVSGENVLIASGGGMEEPSGVAYDDASGAVYWTDSKGGNIQRLLTRCAAGRARAPSLSGDVFVEHGLMTNGGLAAARCPAGHTGLVGLVCQDGSVAATSGRCAASCPAGHLTLPPDPARQGDDTGGTATPQSASPAAVVVKHGGMSSGQSVSARCPDGLVGPVVLHCLEGDISIVAGEGGAGGAGGGRCQQPVGCAAGAARVLEGAVVLHDAMGHGGVLAASCPEGFAGNVTLGCRDGAVFPVEGLCRASCEAGTLWVRSTHAGARASAAAATRKDEPLPVRHGTILPGHDLRVVCPQGWAGGGVRLRCRGSGLGLAAEDANCIKTSGCAAGSVAAGGAEVRLRRVRHGAMEDGQVAEVGCPLPFVGRAILFCVGGTVSVDPEKRCRRNCPRGAALDGNGLQVPHDAALDGNVVVAKCPSGFAGAVQMRCDDGVATIDCSVGDSRRCACRPQRALDSPSAGGGVPAGMLPPLLGVFLLCLAAMGLLASSRSCRQKGGAGLAWCVPHRLRSGAGGAARATTLPAEERSPRRRHDTNDCNDDCDFAAAESGSSARGAGCGVIVPLPSYWATAGGVHITPDSNRIAEVQRLMTDTWRVCYTRDRRTVPGGGARVPVGCRVASVLRVENHGGYERYFRYKQELAGGGTAAEPFRTLTDNRLNLLDDDCGEKYLFHGTDPEAAHAIARNLFRIDMAGSSRGCMFGPGIYAAENASKSDEYAGEGSGVYLGLCAVLVCRAATGRVLNVQSPGDYAASAGAGAAFDSVCGDRLAAAGTFREMVFFREEAVYPEFIVIYARLYDN